MKNKRNYGIDLLRVVAMLFIVILHSLGKGGVLDAAENSIQWKSAWILEIIAFCAVDVFAIISGYVSWNKKIKYSKVIILWFQVIFYSLIIVGVANIINPNIVTYNDYIKSFFPLITNRYWYFTAYIGLIIFKPILDVFISRSNKDTLKKIFITFIIAFSFFDIIANRFLLNFGYSAFWLIILYIIGAIISKCEIGKNIKNWHIIIGVCCFILLTCIGKFYGPGNITFLQTNYNIAISGAMFIDYTSPTILCVAILLVIGFSRMKFSDFLKKIIKFFSISSFAVYLINTHYIVYNYYTYNKFSFLVNDNIFKIYLIIISFSILFVIISILIDKIRIIIFKVLKIDKLSEMLYTKMIKIVHFISKNI